MPVTTSVSSLGLDKLYKEKIIREMDSGYKTLIINSVRKVVAGIKSESKFFAKYFKEIHYAGSHWENLDVNKDDTDADVNIVLGIGGVDLEFDNQEEKLKVFKDR